MVIDNEVEIVVRSSRTISKLNEINFESKKGDVIKISIDKLWENSNIKVNVECDVCGNVKYINFSMYNKNIKKYNIYTCSNKCSVLKNKRTCLERYGCENYNNLEKRSNTNMERYGCENYNNPEKRSNTNMERYGVEYTMMLKEVRDKSKSTKYFRYGDENYNNTELTKKTNLKKYGMEHYSKTEEYKEKVKNTCLDRYGVDNYSKTQEYSKKVKSTNMERYGCESSNSSDLIKEKKVLSMLSKYGFISNSMTQESKEKLKSTNMERYGVEYPMQLLEFSYKQQKNSKTIKYYNENLYYQSSYEKDFLDHCLKCDLLCYVSRGPTIKFKYDNMMKVHYPDFYIEKYNLIIEIKSDYYYYKYLEKNKIKLQTSIDLGYNYLFIINKKYDFFNNIITNLSGIKKGY
jgi:hypothetical protein